MTGFDEAIGLICSVVTPLGSESVPLEEAAGRVLARAVVAGIDSPRADVSAMDGYAVRDADLARLPTRLRVIGESFAGRGWQGAVEPGTCARIFTGAPLPPGADRVVMQEMVKREGDIAIVDERAGARHVRSRRSDFSAGEELLQEGTFLGPRAIVAAAGADLARVDVFLQPRFAILSTGDELARPGTARERADAIPESVSYGVAAIARQWGAISTGHSRLADDLPAMRSAAEAALEVADVVVVTGGASVGEKDFAKAMFEPSGLELVFSKLSIKPGKPVWLGRVGERFVVGLPGNPTSALVTARLLLVPLLARMRGQPVAAALSWRPAILASPLPSCGPRETFHRATLDRARVEVLSFQDSSAQKALASADVLVRQRAGSGALAAGSEVEILDF
jgi:molybdopterin molybdotransferase